jgi:NTE family protein
VDVTKRTSDIGESRPRGPRVGLALGSGSARGWAHIGVIRALVEAGIQPDIVCGTSVGAFVGAAYAAGELDRLEPWVLRLRLRDVVALLDVSLGSGLFKGQRLMDFIRLQCADRPIEELKMPFGAVATVLETGKEIWLRHGSTLDAVRASIALPAFFAPVVYDGRVVVDGGLVNPVPVSLARAMGADVVIAVDLGADKLGHHQHALPAAERPDGVVGDWIRRLQETMGVPVSTRSPDLPAIPTLPEVVASSIDIMQVQIARSRMAGEPPDVIVAPRLAHLHMLDFHCGEEAIREGFRAVHRVADALSLINSEAAARVRASDPTERGSHRKWDRKSGPGC